MQLLTKQKIMVMLAIAVLPFSSFAQIDLFAEKEVFMNAKTREINQQGNTQDLS
jgi:hypothetical protein